MLASLLPSILDPPLLNQYLANQVRQISSVLSSRKFAMDIFKTGICIVNFYIAQQNILNTLNEKLIFILPT